MNIFIPEKCKSCKYYPGHCCPRCQGAICVQNNYSRYEPKEQINNGDKIKIHCGYVDIKIALYYDKYDLEIKVRNGLNGCLVEYEIDVWKIKKDYSEKKRIHRSVQRWGYNIDLEKISNYVQTQLKEVK